MLLGRTGTLVPGTTRVFLRRTPGGIRVLASGLRYPSRLRPVEDVNAGLGMPPPGYGRACRMVAQLVPAGRAVVAVFAPAGASPERVRALADVLGRVRALAVRVPHRREVLRDLAGPPLLSLDVPEGFGFEGTVVTMGGGTQFPVYGVSDGTVAFETGAVGVSTVGSTGPLGGWSAATVTIDGVAGMVPLGGPPDDPQTLAAWTLEQWRRRSGRSWTLEEVRPLPVPEAPGSAPRTVAGAPWPGMIGPQQRVRSFALLVRGRSGGLRRWTMATGAVLELGSPGPFQTFGISGAVMSLETFQVRADRAAEDLALLAGVRASRLVHPEGTLSALARARRISMEATERILATIRGYRDALERGNAAWANILGEEMFVRDPETAEVWKVPLRDFGTWLGAPDGGAPMFAPEGTDLAWRLQEQGWRELERWFEPPPGMQP